jgi:predicted ArsR family transcriptional regulator
VSTSDDDQDAQLSRLASLGEPIRRMLYRFVAVQRDPVSRDQAAAGVGVARHIAKFHLDRLADDGLLDTEYRRPAGRNGPGAGRPTKLYQRTENEIVVSLPERRYELTAEIMAQAITAAEHSGVSPGAALHTAAREAGRQLGAQVTLRRPRHGARSTVAVLWDVLIDNGYEPYDDGARITLANCPFHRLVVGHTELVCDLNLHLISGLLDSQPPASLQARLEPSTGRCCVILTADVAGGTETGTETVDILTRWELFGGAWRVIEHDGAQVTISLCRCDGGEEQQRLTSTDSALIGWLGDRTRSDPTQT